MKVKVAIKKIGKGTQEDPFRPALINSDGKEYGKDIPGITFCVRKDLGDMLIIEIDKKDLEVLQTNGVKLDTDILKYIK